MIERIRIPHHHYGHTRIIELHTCMQPNISMCMITITPSTYKEIYMGRGKKKLFSNMIKKKKKYYITLTNNMGWVDLR